MPKFFVYGVSDSTGEKFLDTEEKAIEYATRRVTVSSSKKPYYVFKAVKVVRAKNLPVEVEEVAAE